MIVLPPAHVAFLEPTAHITVLHRLRISLDARRLKTKTQLTIRSLFARRLTFTVGNARQTAGPLATAFQQFPLHIPEIRRILRHAISFSRKSRRRCDYPHALWRLGLSQF